jgi:hypothetical protein
MLSMPERKQVKTMIDNKNNIQAFLHCALCLAETPQDQSPKDYQRIQAGWTKEGLQIWCNRHECNIIHIDFEGHRHPALTTKDLGGKDNETKE